MNTQLALNDEEQMEDNVLEIKLVDSNNPHLDTLKFYLFDEVSIQVLSENTYLVRMYNEGENHPNQHQAVVTVVTDSTHYHLYGYLAKGDIEPQNFIIRFIKNLLEKFGFKFFNGFKPKTKHNRIFHKFFKDMGLKPFYVRNKHL
jgi:hypothetical protein